MERKTVSIQQKLAILGLVRATRTTTPTDGELHQLHSTDEIDETSLAERVVYLEFHYPHVDVYKTSGEIVEIKTELYMYTLLNHRFTILNQS